MARQYRFIIPGTSKFADVSEEAYANPSVRKELERRGYKEQNAQLVPPAKPVTTSAVTGRTEGGRQSVVTGQEPIQTWQNARGEEKEVPAKESDILPGLWRNRTSESPGPGFERKYGPWTALAQRLGQGVTLGMGDDAVAGLVTAANLPGKNAGRAANEAINYVEDWYRKSAEENPIAAPAELLGMALAPNPLGFAGRAGNAAARATTRPLTPAVDAAVGRLGGLIGERAAGKVVGAAEKSAPLLRSIGNNGLMPTANRGEAMLAQTVKSGGYGGAARLGEQPIGEKDLGDAVQGGAEAALVSGGLQVAGFLPVTGNPAGGTGGGRLLQHPDFQETSIGSQFVRPGPLQAPNGLGSWLLPWQRADRIAAAGNPNSLVRRASDAAVSASRVSPGTLAEVTSSRGRLGSTPEKIGETLVTAKVPETFLPKPEGLVQRGVAAARQTPLGRWFFGTGEVPLLPAGSNARNASQVYEGALDSASRVIDRVDRAAPPIDAREPIRAAQAAVEAATQRGSIGLEQDAGSVPARLLAAKDKLTPDVPIQVPTYAPVNYGRPPVVAVDRPTVRPRTLWDPPVMEKVEIPNPAYQQQNFPGTPVLRGGDVRSSNPELLQTVKTVTNNEPMFVEAVQRVNPQPPIRGVAHGGFVGEQPRRNAVVGTKPATVPATYSPVPMGNIRTGLNAELRGIGDYAANNPAAPVSEATLAATAQSAVAGSLDDHWKATLPPDLLRQGQDAKDLMTLASLGKDLTNPLRGATAGPRSIDSSLKALTTAQILSGMGAGPGTQVAARQVMNTVDRASDINPGLMTLARRAEGIRGQGIGFGEQRVGDLIRGAQRVPGFTNRAIAQDGVDDGPVLFTDEPWQNVVNRFLGNLKR